VQHDCDHDCVASWQPVHTVTYHGCRCHAAQAILSSPRSLSRDIIAVHATHLGLKHVSCWRRVWLSILRLPLPYTLQRALTVLPSAVCRPKVQTRGTSSSRHQFDHCGTHVSCAVGCIILSIRRLPAPVHSTNALSPLTPSAVVPHLSSPLLLGLSAPVVGQACWISLSMASLILVTRYGLGAPVLQRHSLLTGAGSCLYWVVHGAFAGFGGRRRWALTAGCVPLRYGSSASRPLKQEESCLFVLHSTGVSPTASSRSAYKARV
jgi:hypothetical protein